MADRGGTVVRAAVADGAYAQVRASRDGKFLAPAFDDTKEAIVSILPLDGQRRTSTHVRRQESFSRVVP